jgi:hypothetical protein
VEYVVGISDGCSLNFKVNSGTDGVGIDSAQTGLTIIRLDVVKTRTKTRRMLLFILFREVLTVKALISSP